MKCCGLFEELWLWCCRDPRNLRKFRYERSHTFLGGVLGEELMAMGGCNAADDEQPSMSSSSSGRTVSGVGDDDNPPPPPPVSEACRSKGADVDRRLWLLDPLKLLLPLVVAVEAVSVVLLDITTSTAPLEW